MEHQIKQILKQKGMTQKELAEALGMSLQQINNTVSGRNTASMAVFERIAEALGVEFWQLFAPADTLQESISQPVADGEVVINKGGNKFRVSINVDPIEDKP